METRLAEFKVRNIGLAARCEVCHQDDRFNAETGECARCQSFLITLAPPKPENPTSVTPISPFGLKLASLATILSTIMAIPGIGGVLLFFSILLKLVSDFTLAGVHLIRDVGILVVLLGSIGAGYYLLYWYAKILRLATESDQRRKLWFWSTVYNFLLLLGIIFFLIQIGVVGEPLSLLWLGPVGVMTVISGLGYREECRPD